MKTMFRGLCVIFGATLVLGASLLTAGPQANQSFFEKSLHHRGEGMRYWYEKDDGFMQITGVPYNELGCKNCHIKTCDPCHAEKTGDIMTFSTEKAKRTETCLPCHSREQLSMKLDKDAGTDDVHFAADMTCADCHQGKDVHGDGNPYSSMRQEGALNTKCTNCHATDSDDAPNFKLDIEAHKRHNKTHDCAACHVQSTMACLNCHFGEFLKTGKKKGNFIPAKDWLLLINYQGKVTSATAMTFVHKNPKEPDSTAKPFVVYAPYFTHSVSKKGRVCSDCHGTDVSKQMNSGRAFRMSSFKDGQLNSFKGVAPVVADLLTWEYLDKKDGKWIIAPVEGEVKSQIACYGKALTKEQMGKLAQEQSESN